MANQLFRKKSITTILKDAEAGCMMDIPGLKKVLGVRDLTFFGVAAVIGAGIFSGIGQASANGGPGCCIPVCFYCRCLRFCSIVLC